MTRIADDREGRLVADSVDFNFESREFVFQEFLDGGEEDAGAPEPFLEPQTHLPHDPRVESDPGHQEKRPAAGQPRTQSPPFARLDELRRLAEFERDGEL